MTRSLSLKHLVGDGVQRTWNGKPSVARELHWSAKLTDNPFWLDLMRNRKRRKINP
jgi:hypothetical protein